MTSNWHSRCRGITSIRAGLVALFILAMAAQSAVAFSQLAALQVNFGNADLVGDAWSLSPGGTSYANGYTLENLPPGTYTIYFTPVAGFLTPAPFQTTLVGGDQTTVTATYEGITSEPQSVSVAAGGTATFTVGVAQNVAVNPATYQWKYSSSGGNFQNIAGATSASYTITNAGSGNAGSYEVVVTWGADGSETSTPATLSISTSSSIPVITSATTVSATVGSPFSYQITATNPPDTFSLIGLPTSFVFNPSSGVISGTPTQVGVYSISLTASNAAGTATMTLTLTVVSAAGQPPIWTNGSGDNSWSDASNWSTGVVPGITTAGSTNQQVTIGAFNNGPFIGVDTGTISTADLNIILGSLTFTDPAGATLANLSSENLTVNGPITNTTGAPENLNLPVTVGGTNATYTYAGGPSGGSLNFGFPLVVGSNTILTTGTITVGDGLYFAINANGSGRANATNGTIGPVTLDGATTVGLVAGSTYPSVATLAGDTGDLFQLTSGNFAGGTAAPLNQTNPFTDPGLTWVTGLIGKGILFVEPSAGGNVINSGIVLPVGADAELNGIGTATFGITLNGGELETANDGALDTGGTIGASFSTTKTIGINTSGGTIAAATGTTATFSGAIRNGNSSTGPLIIGDVSNTGIVNLGGTNTYTGTTLVRSGTLEVSGSIASNSAMTVGNNTAVATLAGNGTIDGPVTTVSTGANVAHIAPSLMSGTAGTLTLGNKGLTLGSGTALDMIVGPGNAPGSNSLIQMNGGVLTISGTITINYNTSGLVTPMTGQVYTLIDGAASISGFNASNITSTGLSVTTGGVTASLIPTYFVAGGSLDVTFQSSQVITFSPIASQTPGAAPITLNATASSSLPVTYTILSGPATLSGPSNNIVTVTGTGTVIIQASQPGNTNYAAATSVTQSFQVASPLSFAAWEADYNIFSSPAATPENDGVPSLLKYVFDINPTQPISAADRTALPEIGTTTVAGIQTLTFTYRQSASLTGVTVNIQTSTDLQTWTTGAPNETQIGTDPVTSDPIMQVSLPAGGAMPQFVRLQVVYEASTVYTIPEGYLPFSYGASISTIYLSFPLTADPVYAGIVGAVTANTISASAASWSSGSFASTGAPFFVKFLSGLEVGRTMLVTANTANSLTLDTTDNSTQTTPLNTNGFSVAAGDAFEIFPGNTLATFFGNNTTPSPLLLNGGASAITADEVGIYSPPALGFLNYYFNTGLGYWVQNGSTVNANNTILYPYSASTINRRSTLPFTLAVIGRVSEVNQLIKTTGNSALIYSCTQFPVTMTLSQLEFGPGWTTSSSPFTADSVSFYLAGPAGFVSYYQLPDSTWRTIGGPSADVSNTIIPAGTVLGILHRRPVTGAASFLQSVMPYSLN